MTSNRHSKPPVNMLHFERELWAKGIEHVAGIDEAGRGPLAGPVVAAAVVFEHEKIIDGVNDSKTLSEELREELYERITAEALAYGVGIVHHDIIDAVNILQATYKAMHEAVQQLFLPPNHLLIDGNRFNGGEIPFTTIIDGDALSFSIAAASIIAKVTRDGLMTKYDTLYPGYGFAKHKGYATPEHRDAIKQLGLCEIHRRSFTVRPQLELDFSD